MHNRAIHQTFAQFDAVCVPFVAIQVLQPIRMHGLVTDTRRNRSMALQLRVRT